MWDKGVAAAVDYLKGLLLRLTRQEKQGYSRQVQEFGVSIQLSKAVARENQFTLRCFPNTSCKNWLKASGEQRRSGWEFSLGTLLCSDWMCRRCFELRPCALFQRQVVMRIPLGDLRTEFWFATQQLPASISVVLTALCNFEDIRTID